MTDSERAQSQYMKELLLLQKLIRFRRHEVFSEDEAPLLRSLIESVEYALDILTSEEEEEDGKV